jgi:quinol monooxygenase YgiN
MSEIVGIGRVKFNPGGLEEYTRLVEQELELVRANEPGTLALDIYVSADGSQAVYIERYRDSRALLDHFQNVSEFMAPVLATGTFEGEILGDVSDELRAAIGEGGPVKLYRPLMMLHPETVKP